jgi:hypothetical protein
MSFWSKVLNIVKDTPRAIITAPNAIISLPVDLAKRAYYKVTDQMNMDIVKDGILLSGVKDLKSGDILLKQGAYDATSYVIMGGQSILNTSGHRYQNAGLLGHAAIYVGDYSYNSKTKNKSISGDVIESVGEGVMLSSLAGEHNKKYSWYVIRCNDASIAEKICKYAKDTLECVKYEAFAALWSGISSNRGISSFLDFREDETARIKKLVDDYHKNNKTGYVAAMFCSELVAYCLNCACDEAKRDRYFGKGRQDLITPEDVYVTLRDSDEWTYKGELKKHVR